MRYGIAKKNRRGGMTREKMHGWLGEGGQRKKGNQKKESGGGVVSNSNSGKGKRRWETFAMEKGRKAEFTYFKRKWTQTVKKATATEERENRKLIDLEKG